MTLRNEASHTDQHSWLKNGILNLERLVEVKREKGIGVLIPKINILFTPPLEEKRIIDAIDNEVGKETPALEDLCERICMQILNLGAENVFVDMQAEYVITKLTPSTKLETQATYKIITRTFGSREKLTKALGVEVVGISACPCAQEEIRKKLNLRKEIPLPTHNQRNVTTLIIENPEDVDVEELIRIIEKSMSACIYEVLKRSDEVEVVLKAHENPFFVEDIVRNVLFNVKKLDLNKNSKIYVRSVSFETIHQHNAVAEKVVRFGEL